MYGLEIQRYYHTFVSKELFDSMATQNIEMDTVTKLLPLLLK